MNDKPSAKYKEGENIGCEDVGNIGVVLRKHQKRYFCRGCLCSMWDDKKLHDHELICIQNKPAKLIMPRKGECEISSL